MKKYKKCKVIASNTAKVFCDRWTDGQSVPYVLPFLRKGNIINEMKFIKSAEKIFLKNFCFTTTDLLTLIYSEIYLYTFNDKNFEKHQDTVSQMIWSKIRLLYLRISCLL